MPSTRLTTGKQTAGPPVGPGEKSPSGTAAAASVSNAVLQQDITTLSNKVLTKLDTIYTDLQSMNRRLDEVESSIEFNASKITEVVEQKLPKLNSELHKEITELQEKQLLMEIQSRKPNLLFYGIQQAPDEDIYHTLTEAFINLGVNEDSAREIQLVNAHRLPRRNPPQPNTPGAIATPRGPPPPPTIIAKFVKMADRDLILGTFENQNQPKRPQQATEGDEQPLPPSQPRITVRTDLPFALKARRGHLAEVAYNLRKKKNLSTRIKLQRVKIILQVKEKGSSNWRVYEE